MKRTDAPGATPENLFTDGDPSSGEYGTQVEETWLNNVQEEIAGVIEGAGIALDGEDHTQLLQALGLLTFGKAYGLTTMPTQNHYVLNTGVGYTNIGTAGKRLYLVKFNAPNTGPAFITVDSAAEVPVHQADGSAFAGGELDPARYYLLTSDGANLVIVSGSGGGDGVPIGASFWHNGPTAPPGSLVENGAAVSRTTYAALFAVIGTTYGAGDGTTTFNLPDTLGKFIRASSPNSSALDATQFVATTTSGSTALTVTDYRLQQVFVGQAISGTGIAAGATITAVSGTNITMSAPATANGTVTVTAQGRPIGTTEFDDFRAHAHQYGPGATINYAGGGGSASVNYAAVNAGNTASAGGAETRPVNIAKLPCIKAFGAAQNPANVNVTNLANDLNALEVYVAGLGKGAKAKCIFDGVVANNLNGTYSRVGTTLTVTATAHGHRAGHQVYCDFTSGGALDGLYTVTSAPTPDTFTITTVASTTISGNVTLLRRLILASENVASVVFAATGSFYVNYTNPINAQSYPTFTVEPGGNGIWGCVYCATTPGPDFALVYINGTDGTNRLPGNASGVFIVH